jgi:hypothetical protein
VTVIDQEERIQKELELLQAEIHGISTEALDRDIAEFSIDVRFLESQVQADFPYYSPENLEKAKKKIHHIRQKIEILKIELDSRQSN